MGMRAPTARKTTLFGGALLAILAAATPADAESIIKNPGDHPPYRFELEPHALFGWSNRFFGGNGFGAGVRGTVVIVDNGFVKTINNSVGISFGLDFLHYDYCYYRNVNCGGNALHIPVAMQWNFWLSPQWSVFGEPGLMIYHGIYDDPCRDVQGRGIPGCRTPTRTGLDWAFWAGGRFHFNDKIALTMRIGYPTFSIGASFLF